VSRMSPYSWPCHLVIQSLVLVTHLASGQFPDTLWTCPSWSCAGRGAFSLPTPVPTSPAIAWNWTQDSIVYGNPGYKSPGCTTSVSTVACPTSDGYVSIHAKTGNEHWTSKTNSSPYLPIVDMYGNVIKSDKHQYDFVIKNNKLEGSANLTQYSPKFGASVTIQQTVVLTSTNSSGPQIVTYGWFGSEFASTSLKYTLKNVSGTFIPCAHPLIDYDRAYIIGRFISDNVSDPNNYAVYGLRRLFAIDITGNDTPNHIAWEIEIPDLQPPPGKLRDDLPNDDDYKEIFLGFFNKTIYVSYESQRDAESYSDWQPVPPPTMLCAVRDLGNSSKILFTQVSVAYGPMAIYDITLSLANITITGIRPVWIVVKNSQSWIAAYHPETGKGLAGIILDEVVGVNNSLGVITTDLHVTRQPDHPDRDVLVFGTQDTQGQAHLVALEVGLPPVKPRVLWSMNVSGEKRAPGRVSQWTIGSQISSFVTVKGEDKAVYGLVVSVVESLLWVNANQVYVRMIM